MVERAVLISIQPKGCELIASGRKTIEVRKTKPKIPTPFKCYIYCTKPKSKNDLGICLEDGKVGLVYQCNYDAAERYDMQILSGKVIGEYICNEIFDYCYDTTYGLYRPINEKWFFIADNDVPLDDMCLNQTQFIDYGKNEDLHGWHISDLKIYDKSKELSEFCVIDKDKLKECPYRERICQNPEFTNGNYLLGGYSCSKTKEPDFDIIDFCRGGCADVFKPLTRPPQSWCYVERLVGEE